MHYLLILGLMVSCTLQQETPPNRCDEPRTIQYSTPCTSCAAAPAVMCARGFLREQTSKDIGNADCSYMVVIGERQFDLPGCTHTCKKVVTERRCCPDFWGPLCLPCPQWAGRTCNLHGTCMNGKSGNGTCACKEGYSGFACQKCANENAYGEHCTSECSCVHGHCNSGPEGDGECHCQPPYSGPKCDQVSTSCSNCTIYSYCKGEGENAVCECNSGFRKIGYICSGVCSPSDCDVNAECSYKGGKKQCKCKEGYEGDGEFCTPVNPCSKDNGGCPSNSTICEYTDPGKSRCVCISGMESSSPSTGCTLKSACTESTCHSNARCETGQDGIPRCICDAQQIGDGRRCYGNIMERILELDRDGNQKGKLSGTIALFEKGCELTLSKHGPFTAFVPLLKSPLPGMSETFLCKHHLVLGQRLFKDLDGNNFITYGGEAIRFKKDKQFIFMKDPHTLFTVVQSDIPASNGIIHIIDMPITNLPADTSANAQYASKTIGEIFAKDERFNRFLSLVDNCGAPMPLRGPGPLTVFVPTNNAVDKFRDGSIIYMLTDAKHKLQELVKHHMFSAAALTVDQLASMPEIQTMANQVILINVTSDGRIMLGQAGFDTKDIVASNGIIHLIDHLLVPHSIVPIMPHRCDLNERKITVGPCVRCSYLYVTHCPTGSTELDSHLKDCEYQSSPFSSVLSQKGCAKYCNTTQVSAECCKGFYGPDCKPCLGGFQHPCYDKGTCNDGIHGNGTCNCAPDFKGIACHICSDPTKHGEKCDEDCHCLHGVCDNRPGSMGVCRRGSCLEGYLGDSCDKTATPCNSDSVFEHCHVHAYCNYTESYTMCVCRPGYEGDGHSCTAANLCLRADKGGCDANAQCIYAGPGNVSCVCNEGWTGDGLVCAEINNCLLANQSGCHKNADCKFIGPGQSECTCKKGYMGDGLVCALVNPCRIDNGGCHELATCKLEDEGTHVCICPEGYGGDGTRCYGNVLVELDGNADFYRFYSLIQRSHVFDLDGNVTALVPSRDAFYNFSGAEEEFWFDYYRLPHLVKAHFLEGSFSTEDLQQQVNKKLPTLQTKTKWEIKNINGDIMVDNATILVADIRAVNGYIHIINTILRPPLSDLPPMPPSLMEFLNKTPTFSLFRTWALLCNLSDNFPSRDYTILIPSDSAIQEYLRKTNSTQLGEDVFKYHVIPSEQLFPKDLSDGTLKGTLLGSSYQIMFHMNSKNETLANEVLLDGNFNETRHGVIMGIPQVLEIHKNRCEKDVVLKVSGLCGRCDLTPRCPYNSKPMKTAFPPNMRSNCKYRKRVGRRRKYVPGCVMECLRKTRDHSCCPGYFGHDCFKCPGKLDNWCSNNGNCQDSIFGNGECLCNEGFHGTACEMCEGGRYGKDCKSECHCNHGKCLDGIDGNGQCLCYKGWKGVNCSVEIIADACGGVCDENANCISGGSGVAPTCSCVAGYQGNGTSCKEIYLCATDNGGCSVSANCTKTSAGERSCTCHEGYTGDGVVCLEIDHCSENNGGCDRNADCIKTGPNMVGCTCKAGYSAIGQYYCVPINLCKKENGGCSRSASCRFTGPGERNCSCHVGYRGDGFECTGTISRELLRKPEAQWYRLMIYAARVRDLYTKGTYTVFVPHTDYSSNFTMEPWVNASRAQDLLRYHIVACEELLLSELKSTEKVLAVSGHLLHFSVREGVLYINGDTKIVSSDFLTSNGVMHFIDKVLTPYDLKDNTKVIPPTLNVSAAAEAYGYSTFSKLLQNANMMSLLEDPFLHPFTMFWPTDKVFRSLSDERKRWLYSEDHKDKLAGYLKAHIVRNEKSLAVNLANGELSRTLYGSLLTFGCDKTLIGEIKINDNDAKITERHMLFDTGIAYGIDQLLEPPNFGARCDDFVQRPTNALCGSCISPPQCRPSHAEDTGKTTTCTFVSPYHFHRHGLFDDLTSFPGLYGYGYGYGHRYGFGPRVGCSRVCKVKEWMPLCCKNHYGRDCQGCPGGLEAPCGNLGDCDDGRYGTGMCKCHLGSRGTACELCKPSYYGSNCTACNCTENGKCDDGLDGDGSCFCQEGWTGTQCESKLEIKPVCTPECHPNAVCLPENQCECEPPYEGNGVNCTAPDLCSEYNGGCHQHASCTQVGINVTCSCLSGYSGDGNACSPIDRCVDEVNGGCSDFATCIFTGPNERRCECLPGYVGNGVQCLEKLLPPIDRCLDDNGGCDPKATCKDLHFHTNTAGVFHLRSPAGKYKLNFTNAEAACQAEDATLATIAQLSDGQQLGMHLCVAGWMDGKKVGYPTTFPSVKCGDNHVGIVLYKDPVETSSKYDAYCYRMKEVSCVCGKGYVGDGEFCNGNLASVVATNSNFSVFYASLLKYAESAVEGENLLNFLSTSSSNTTLFVPHNGGFAVNESLTWRDMEYHTSTNNSIHLYENLKNSTVIPSRLGYNISVMIPTNTTPTNDLQPYKLVNKRIIVDWNIPAFNGIIHVIHGPLRAPPVPFTIVLRGDVRKGSKNGYAQEKSEVRTPGHSVVTAILITCIIICVVAGITYYVFKKKNDAFRFQYFKNDEDDGTPTRGGGNPALVSIPNPLYSGYRAFTEPFGDSHEVESAETPDLLD